MKNIFAFFNPYLSSCFLYLIIRGFMGVHLNTIGKAYFILLGLAIFISDIRNVYGDKADKFSFNENGILQLNEKAKDFTKDMSKEQKKAFKGLDKAMNDEQVTSIVYANTQDLTIDGQTKSVDIINEFGGGVYSKADNMIVIAPDVGAVTVTLDEVEVQLSNGVPISASSPKQDVQQNTTSTLFHEIRERNTSNTQYRGPVIDYENYVRNTIGLPARPYDMNHSKKFKTEFKK